MRILEPLLYAANAIALLVMGQRHTIPVSVKNHLTTCPNTCLSSFWYYFFKEISFSLYIYYIKIFIENQSKGISCLAFGKCERGT